MNKTQIPGERVVVDEIRPGDLIQCWLPAIIPTGGWPPGRISTDTWVMVSERRAATRAYDLAGRWTGADGRLVTQTDGPDRVLIRVDPSAGGGSEEDAQ